MYFLKLFFAFGESGFSEKYTMTASSRATAKADAATLITARLGCLPEGVFLEWAVVSESNSKKDGSSVLPATRTGSLTGANFKIERIAEALHYRFETVDGEWSNRMVHGIPDRNIVEEEYVTDIVGDTFPAALVTYLDAVKTLTVMRLVDRSTTPPTVTVKDYDAYTFRKVGGRKVGRPFDVPAGRRKAGS